MQVRNQQLVAVVRQLTTERERDLAERESAVCPMITWLLVSYLLLRRVYGRSIVIWTASWRRLRPSWLSCGMRARATARSYAPRAQGKREWGLTVSGQVDALKKQRDMYRALLLAEGRKVR
jgi:hypothetical protein